jgi:Alginate export
MAQAAGGPVVSRDKGIAVSRNSQHAVAKLVLVLALICPGIASAQSAEHASAPAQGSAMPPPKVDTAPAQKRKLGPLDISGSWRVRVEGWAWFEGTKGNSNYAFGHSLLRVAIGQEGERFDWQLDAAQDTILGLPTDAVVAAPQGQLGGGGTYFAANGNRPNNANGFLRQAFVRFKKLGNGNLWLGRFEFQDGTEVMPKDATLATLVKTRIAQRLIGNVGWSAIGRSFDGAQFSYDFGKKNLTLMGARPTRGVYQIDAMGEVNADVYYGALTIPLEARQGAGELRLFSVGYVDRRTSVLKTDNRAQTVRAADQDQIRIGTYGLDYVHVLNTVTRGKFDFFLWGALQSGSWGVQSHSAGSFIGEFGWQPPVKHLEPWLSAGYSYGSGDGNPNDLHHGTFFQVLPTTRPYARFPFYNMMNNEDFYGTLNLKPYARLSLHSEFHALRLNKSSDLWYLGTGAYQPKTFGYSSRPSSGNRSLANVVDISTDYQMTRSFGVGLYYAYAWGRDVIAKIYPNDQNGQFTYVETNLRF